MVEKQLFQDLLLNFWWILVNNDIKDIILNVLMKKTLHNKKEERRSYFSFLNIFQKKEKFHSFHYSFDFHGGFTINTLSKKIEILLWKPKNTFEKFLLISLNIHKNKSKKGMKRFNNNNSVFLFKSLYCSRSESSITVIKIWEVFNSERFLFYIPSCNT